MTAYHDLDSPQTMREDAAAVATPLPRAVPGDTYADLYTGFAQDQPKPGIEISEAAQRLANALHLHLD